MCSDNSLRCGIQTGLCRKCIYKDYGGLSGIGNLRDGIKRDKRKCSWGFKSMMEDLVNESWIGGKG